MSIQLPEYFAIIRQGYRSPSLQILESYPTRDSPRTMTHRGGPFRRHVFMVTNVGNEERFLEASLIRTNIFHREIHEYMLKNSEMESPVHVKGWFLPYNLRLNSITVPIMDFQYRSWVPGEYFPIPIRTNIEDFQRVIEITQRERLSEIQNHEDNLSIRSFHRPGPDDYDDREYYSPNTFVGAGGGRRRNNTPIQEPIIQIEYRDRIVEVPVEIERIVHTTVVQSKPLPLPKSVGDLLIAEARKGTDSCPIAAIPFAECEKIAVSSCFHLFDKASLERWQSNHTSCPVCRCKIENVVSE